MKFIVNLLDERQELFNLEEDAAEQSNLAVKLPDQADRLREIVIQWYRSTEAEFPDEYQPITPELLERLEAIGYGSRDKGK